MVRSSTLLPILFAGLTAASPTAHLTHPSRNDSRVSLAGQVFAIRPLQNAYLPSDKSPSVNIIGLAWDMSVLGSAFSEFEATNCNASYDVYPYYDPPEHYTEWRAQGFNLFRVPVGWQHLQDDLRSELNQTTLQHLDGLIDAITNDGSTAILDVHNYARWYCSVIGQPESNLPWLSNKTVTDDDFVDLWVKLARHYHENPHVMFQLMNEPHDLNITKWAHTNQNVINAIRHLNATQPILISGTQFARLTNWQDYSQAALSTITDPLDNTLYDFHQYFDDDGGAYGVCEPWSTFLPRYEEITNFVRGSWRKAIMTEFGGAPVKACVELVESMLTYFEEHRDVWVGWTAWGSFNPGDLCLTMEPESPFSTLTNVLKMHAPLT
ncbi:glycoside hydrolase family 5 protein [Zasmidium cellare ATCC 36951]|uniref:cellulase n=1 Tax=Zasmidium cellare ATCC 36951 TaxID=1080233 RepID=A0A6A6CMI3_ZASCE|nr:glycoside hydrolase family 5 protein [Zasmidium cellare ATCC 36951]KAF2168251.1 glycoside hydrolase family 5 protein [Zasmidium cellare ATCC 36951]